jgi:hypothetical protein
MLCSMCATEQAAHVSGAARWRRTRCFGSGWCFGSEGLACGYNVPIPNLHCCVYVRARVSWVALPVSPILLNLILRCAVMTAQLRYLASHILPRLYVCSSHRASLCSSPLVLGLR